MVRFAAARDAALFSPPEQAAARTAMDAQYSTRQQPRPPSHSHDPYSRTPSFEISSYSGEPEPDAGAYLVTRASAPALQRLSLGQSAPLVDDVVDPLAEAAGAGGVEEQDPVIAAVESDAGPGGLGNAGDHDDLRPLVRAGKFGDGPGFALGRTRMRNEADHLHSRWRSGTVSPVEPSRENQVGRVSGTGQGETLLYSRSRATEDDDGVRAPRGVGGRPDEEDGGQHQK